MKHARLITSLALVLLSGCSWMPKVKMPFTGGSKSAEDPKVAFDVRRPLAYGHTLKLSVYRNLLSQSRVFRGTVMVDEKGLVHFKGAGDVKVGGRSAYEAVRAIEAAFSRQYGDSTTSVQLASIEDVPLVVVTGAVRSPGVVPWFEGMTADAVLSYVGGRTSHAEARSVHVTRDGARRFHVQAAGVPLKAGDIVSFSKDI